MMKNSKRLLVCLANPFSDQELQSKSVSERFEKLILQCVDFIKKYNSIQEASDLTGIKRCNIGNALSGIQKTAGGFIWKH